MPDNPRFSAQATLRQLHDLHKHAASALSERQDVAVLLSIRSQMEQCFDRLQSVTRSHGAYNFFSRITPALQECRRLYLALLKQEEQHRLRSMDNRAIFRSPLGDSLISALEATRPLNRWQRLATEPHGQASLRRLAEALREHLLEHRRQAPSPLHQLLDETLEELVALLEDLKEPDGNNSSEPPRQESRTHRKRNS